MTDERTVLFVSPYYPPHVGGVETYVHGLAGALQSLPGWRSVVVTTGGGRRVDVREEAPGLRVYRLPVMGRLSYTPIDPRWLFQLRKIIRAEAPQFINVHTPVPGLADVATIAAKDIPVVVTYHAASLTKPGRTMFNVLASAYSLAESHMMTRAQLILGVSEHVGNLLRQKYGDKVAVLENAVDDAILHIAPSTGRPEFSAVFMARLDPTHDWKGLDQLLDSVRFYTTRFDRNLRLLVIGDGADRPRYEALVRDLGITDNVTFAGSLTGHKKFQALRSARALVTCPTSANDAFPTVMLEAWASGVPVVATAVGPLASLVVNEVTGLLVAPRSPATLAAALHCIATRPQLADMLGRNTRAKVSRAYTWQTRVVQFVAMLDKLTYPDSKVLPEVPR
ncbi:MAG TPA: glycosyltransferase family 4 protein [Pseudonocardiaceae bacterium]|nr:glycosyltransferase family 4 protein [Pseudonocardiaceae bacterium]